MLLQQGAGFDQGWGTRLVLAMSWLVAARCCDSCAFMLSAFSW